MAYRSILVFRLFVLIMSKPLAFLFRLAKEKATIGYTYEDSTVTKPGEEEEKGEEDDSENSESEEDEGIPDIGESQYLLTQTSMSCRVGWTWGLFDFAAYCRRTDDLASKIK